MNIEWFYNVDMFLRKTVQDSGHVGKAYLMSKCFIYENW